MAIDLKTIGTWCAKYLPFFTLVFVGSDVVADGNTIETLRYKPVDMSDVSLVTDQNCDKGGYSGKAKEDFLFEVLSPQRKMGNKPRVVITNAGSNIEIHLNQPLPHDGKFTFEEELTMEYSIFFKRTYRASAQGTLERGTLDLQITIRRINEKRPDRLYCTARFRLRNRK